MKLTDAQIIEIGKRLLGSTYPYVVIDGQRFGGDLAFLRKHIEAAIERRNGAGGENVAI